MKDLDSNDIPEGYLRVTTVLSPFISFANIAPKVLAHAADRGSRVHALCESYIKARTLHAQDFVIEQADEECKSYLQSFAGWYEKIVGQSEYTEKRLNCPKLKISGKFDVLTQIKGDDELTIIDFKTPQSPALSWRLQTAAYRLLLKSVEGRVAIRRMSLILNKNGKNPRVVEYTDHENDEKLFLKALELYRFFHA